MNYNTWLHKKLLMVNQNITDDLILLDLNFLIDTKWTNSGNYQTGVQTITPEENWPPPSIQLWLGLGLEATFFGGNCPRTIRQLLICAILNVGHHFSLSLIFCVWEDQQEVCLLCKLCAAFMGKYNILFRHFLKSTW